jgi:predicted metal-dependent HD superfamily phosphohydrolase
MEMTQITKTSGKSSLESRTGNYFGKIRAVYKFTQTYMGANTNHPYHNWEHAKDVTHAAIRYAKMEGVTKEEGFLLATAAMLHDVYFQLGGKENEEISAKLAGMVLPQFGYTSGQIGYVQKMILATKLPTKPETLLEKIICDADLDNAGRPDCIEQGYNVATECNVPDEKKPGFVLYFLKNIAKYYTDSAKQMREVGIKKNIAALEMRMA